MLPLAGSTDTPLDVAARKSAFRPNYIARINVVRTRRCSAQKLVCAAATRCCSSKKRSNASSTARRAQLLAQEQCR